MVEITGTQKLSPECMRNGLQMIDGLKNLKTWAFRILDASAKSPDGLLIGSTTFLGNYDECLGTIARSSRSRDYGKILFTGKYCLLEIKPELPPKRRTYRMYDRIEEFENVSSSETIIDEIASRLHTFYSYVLNLGVCVPSGCKKEDLEILMNSVLKDLHLDASVYSCEVKENINFSKHKFLSRKSLYAFIGMLVIIASFVDAWLQHKGVTTESNALRVLLAFSVLKNFSRLFSTEKLSDRLTCLNGIRVLTLLSIIYGHSYYFLHMDIFMSKMQLYDIMAKDFLFQIILNMLQAVDPFFFLSGFLLCYWVTISVRDKKKPFNIPYLIIRRLFRLLPAYYFVFTFAFLMRDLGSGPFYHKTLDRHMGGCDKYWWTNLLFINNFYKYDNLCMVHTWYIACDFQLFIFSLFLLLVLFKWPKVGISLSFTVIFAAMIYDGLFSYVYNMPNFSLATHPDPEEHKELQHNIYLPISHAAPYFTGILIGYLLATKPDLKISKCFQILGWLMAIMLTSCVVFGPRKWQSGIEPTTVEVVAYSATYKLAFVLGVAWTVVCCFAGQGGFINYLLSLKIWTPLARLTFLKYLIHPNLQLIYSGWTKTAFSFDYYVWMAFGHLCISFLLAVIVNMMVESPFMALQKMALGSFEGISKSSAKDINVNKDIDLNSYKEKMPVNGNIVLSINASECTDIDKKSHHN
ncbi:nose resistant to fluoxetine protein 6-like [Stegodyphus dumicola]|uniref:nose resistant to fluoxetine protein 6-like n=1 Tax=Stegodyphus dumicola TaxID=202533 RepID=UPI0015A91BEC|nr:nose resistant to fluoxetine protein 6-like [Stegodyphus dumicola]